MASRHDATLLSAGSAAECSPDPRSTQGAAALVGLLEIMRRLRAPDGCPWDREQSFASIASYTIEEAYEVADAIARADMDDLVDELGDLLFQVVFHAEMAAEHGVFDFADVARAVTEKMVRRHPHVFAGSRRDNDDHGNDQGGPSLNGQWEQIKAAERKARRARKPRGGSGEAPSLLDDVPRGLPAIKRAEKMQRRAARVQFDWQGAAQVLPKLREELDELTEAVASPHAASSADARASTAFEELGDLMFTSVNLARHLGLDAERALAASTAKFERRFRRMEQLAGSAGGARQATGGQDGSFGPLAALDGPQLEALWEASKASLRGD